MLGSGPRGLPKGGFRVLHDPRAYDTDHTASGDTAWHPLMNPADPWPLSPYAQAVKESMPAMWWRLNKPSVYNSYGNSAGCSTLRADGSGTDTIVTGLIPGDRNNAVKLAGGRYLWSTDYRVWPMAWETMMSLEFWVRLDSLPTDAAFAGEWDSSANGWMCYTSGSGSIRMYCGSNFLSASAVFAANRVYHVVCCWGGSGTPTTDYVSRAYVNGVEVLNGNLPVAAGTDTITKTAHFNIGTYKDSTGAGTITGTMQDVAIYNRMLQPREVAQHYEAAFARA